MTLPDDKSQMNGNDEKERISLTLKRLYVDTLDRLVDMGFYMERQEALRAALRILFGLHGIEPFFQIIFPKGEIILPIGDDVDG